jgi:hypothetical protein
MSPDDASNSMRELTLESSNPDPMDVVDTPPKNEMEQPVDGYEVDIFNQNLCIRALTESIEYLHNNVTKPDPNKSAMPVWMKHLFVTFTDKGKACYSLVIFK